MGLSVIILAAGSGKRMVSECPKILHKLGGISLVEHVITTAQQLDADAIHVIYGNGGEWVRNELQSLPINWIRQDKQLGTGHAVAQALPFCEEQDQILILYGDVPLISTRTLNQLLRDTPHHGLGLVVTELEDPTGFGRIIRNEMANIIAIVEHKDASEKQLKINEINTGILTTQAKHLKSWLPKLSNNNKQKEYYLTDIVALAVEDGLSVGGVMAHCCEEVQGVNDRWQLATLERYYQYTQAKKLTEQGVTIMDPTRLDIRGNVKINSDVIIDVNVVMEGNVCIGRNCKIGPNVYLKDSVLGDDVEIKANCVIEGAKIADLCQIGPFARIRPGTEMAESVKIGNFVETKNTSLGLGSKASHLSYLGDAVIGKNVNIGAGTITCNYDGVKKSKTQIDDGAFIGSNTSLMAPIKIGKNAYIAGGSALNRDAPAEQLTIARAEQHTIKDWQRPQLPDDRDEEHN